MEVEGSHTFDASRDVVWPMLLDPEVLNGVIMLRRSLVSLSSVEAMEQLTQTLGKFPTNGDFLDRIKDIL